MANASTVMPDLPPDYHPAPALIAFAAIMLFFTLAVCSLRTYVRTVLTKAWKWDDTTIIIALAFMIFAVTFYILSADSGVGRHIYYLEDPKQAVLDIVKWSDFYQLSICLCTLFTKISISFYILRIHDGPKIRIVLWTLMGIMSAVTMMMVIVLLVICYPLDALWNPSLQGRCIAQSTVYNISYVQSAFTILTDLCLTASPIIILWNVKIRRGRKLFICFLMSLGLVATVSNALRNVWVPEITGETDYSYDILPDAVVCIFEMSSGIIAACVPACMPLFVKKRNNPTYTHPSYPTGATPLKVTSEWSVSHSNGGLESGTHSGTHSSRNDAYSLSSMPRRARLM